MDLSPSIPRRFALGAIPTFAATSILVFAAQAATIHVPGDAPTIQAGVDLAAFGDTVEVACGTYTAGAILKDGIVVRSKTGLADCVTIDIVAGYSAFRAVNLPQGIVLDGFHITSSRADVRGVVVGHSRLTVRNCEIVKLGADDLAYACISAPALWGTTSDINLEGCLFEANSTGDCPLCQHA